MIPPITLDDVITRKTTDNGGIKESFDRAKAAASILAKMHLAIEVFDSRDKQPEIWYYEDGYWHPGGAPLIGYYLDKVAGNLSNDENIRDVLRRISGQLRLTPVEFDITHPYLVGCAGGITLNLQTGKSRKAAPTYLISMPIPVKYDPGAKCPEFIKFLEDITATDDDRLSILDFLSSLLVVQPMDFFVAAPGLGSNGRSKFKDFIRAFIGSDACMAVPFKDLKRRFMAGFMRRCRVNFANETEVTAIALEFIKRCSEKMPAEEKFKGMNNALLFLKWFFDTNVMPVIQDTSYGAERRLVRWDMPWRFVDEPQGPMEKLRDPDIITKITTQEELSGVLNLVLERAPEAITQRMIHHRNGGLLEYALQSRSGDVFIELFLSATSTDKDRVHTDTIRTSYTKYATVTNSNALGGKALKTLIRERLDRYLEKDVKIDKLNRSGYKNLKFDKELFDGTITTLEKARGADKPVFVVLLDLFPDLKNSTNSTLFYHNSTSNIDISNIYGRIVEKVEEKERGKETSEVGKKNDTLSTTLLSLPHKGNQPVDNESTGRILVEKQVEEFLHDGGQSSLTRFLAEFPEAAE